MFVRPETPNDPRTITDDVPQLASEDVSLQLSDWKNQ